MAKKRKIDFIISEDKKYGERLVFRFYPKQSTCHGLNDSPPKSWDEVYKVYYTWAILLQMKDDEDSAWETEVKYDCICDECSIIGDIGYMCKKIADGIFEEEFERSGKKYTTKFLDDEHIVFGDGTQWIIHQYEARNKDIWYEFYLWRFDDVGYRFYLPQSRIKEFGEYLEMCCEHMLENGIGI